MEYVPTFGDICALCGEEAALLKPLDPESNYMMLVCGDCRQRYEDGPDE